MTIFFCGDIYDMRSWCVVFAYIASHLLSSVDGFSLVLSSSSSSSLWLSTNSFVTTQQKQPQCKFRPRTRQVTFSPLSYPSPRRDNSSRCCCIHDSNNAAGEDEAGSTTMIYSSRRHLLTSAIITTSTISSLLLGVLMCNPQMASAKVVSAPIYTAFPDEGTTSSFIERRNELLRVISSTKSTEEDVLSAIQDLVPFGPLIQPSSSSSSSSFSSSIFNSALDGTWKLLWYNKADFSPLLQLPTPLRPTSYQYFGSVAEQEVGPNRAAQGLVGGVVSAVFGKDSELWLSSGIGLSSSDVDESRSGKVNKKLTTATTLTIYPPFRLQLGTIPQSTISSSSNNNNNIKLTIVESSSDADFRKVNSRSVDAQNAPRNEYEQIYTENLGPGSLRISVITKGDPVIVGNMFIHQKL
jgi:hypothetical protein